MASLKERFLEIEVDKRNKIIYGFIGTIFVLGVGYYVYSDFQSSKAELISKNHASRLTGNEVVEVETAIFDDNFWAELRQQQYVRAREETLNSPLNVSLARQLAEVQGEKETFEQVVTRLTENNTEISQRIGDLEKARRQDAAETRALIGSVASTLQDNIQQVADYAVNNSNRSLVATPELNVVSSEKDSAYKSESTRKAKEDAYEYVSIFSLSAINSDYSDEKLNVINTVGTVVSEVNPTTKNMGGPIISETEIPSIVSSGQKLTLPSNEKQDNYSRIPGLSILSGVLITGMDAPASPTAQDNPFPAYIKITKVGLGPNKMKFDLVGCHVLISGYGDLSTHRVQARGEKISCVKENGEDFFLDLKATVTGSDGKSNLRGRLETRDGAFVAATLAAGALSAGATLLQPQVTFNANGNPMPQDINTIMQRAASEGTSSGLDRLAERYARTADQMYPFIVLDAGREVTLVLNEPLNIPN